MDSSKNFLERCTSLAVLGGTFDPIHNGHLAIAEAVLQQFNPQKVLLIPAGAPPHKPDKPITDGEHRYQMVLQSIARIPGLETTKMELERTGSSYTVDTIRELRELCSAGCSIYFILGQDALEDILTWKKAEELLTMCNFIVVPRPGYDNERFRREIKYLKKRYDATIYLLNSQPLDISSTNVRLRMSQNWPVSALVPHEVEEYARRHNLYSNANFDMSEGHFEWARLRLKERLSPKRFVHSAGVVIEAEKLARHYGADVAKARWAGLLHDCTKEYSADKKHALCAQWGIEIDEIVAGHIDLAHGLLGAESARRDYHIEDEEILQAIRYHILGHGSATLLDKIVVLADFIEPYREDYYPLQEMRDLAYVDINKALALGLKAMRDIDSARGKKLHHWSEDCIKLLEGNAK